MHQTPRISKDQMEILGNIKVVRININSSIKDLTLKNKMKEKSENSHIKKRKGIPLDKGWIKCNINASLAMKAKWRLGFIFKNEEGGNSCSLFHKHDEG